MKVVDADWEVRNLGCKTVEMTVEKQDMQKSSEDVCDVICSAAKQHGAQYLIVKADTRYHELSCALQKQGFYLIEVQAYLRLRKTDAEVALRRFAPLCEGAGFHEASGAEVEMVVREVKKGIFTTDRIAIDPHFGVDIANVRYANWILDETRRGVPLHIVTYHDAPIGFFLRKRIDCKRQHSLLGGLFTAKDVQGFGSALDYASAQDFVNQGMQVMKTGVSMNNPKVVQLHLTYGWIITHADNVFVKHMKEMGTRK